MFKREQSVRRQIAQERDKHLSSTEILCRDVNLVVEATAIIVLKYSKKDKS